MLPISLSNTQPGKQLFQDQEIYFADFALLHFKSCVWYTFTQPFLF
jgi:hypothetical protein